MSSFGLNNLRRRHGIDKKAIGRGIGSGCGKTSTYGHKGGKARSGRGKVKWFEGGQMPIYVRLPKRGFVSKKDKSIKACINLQDLQRLCTANVLSANQDVNVDILKKIGAIKDTATMVRLLGKGELKTPLNITVEYATASAVREVEASGGKVSVMQKTVP
ncbi:MAG: 50S ribosomal protein L15 [Holosporaceae bacterium]|jgi:large subunit ribosomal protein L15|nr:50S ribosomal protein L15 [Holosporaceae bacterium]